MGADADHFILSQADRRAVGAGRNSEALPRRDIAAAICERQLPAGRAGKLPAAVARVPGIKPTRVIARNCSWRHDQTPV
jgi:hypothetical protein